MERLPVLTLAALFVGYACSYFHRADLATLAPLLTKDAALAPLHQALPDIASLGMLVYAFGKVVGGLFAERLGGRRLFVLALLLASVAEFAAMQVDTPAAFAACRVLGMAVLGCAWPALGHVVSTVTPIARLATVMALLSQSYLLGDAAVRAVLAAVVANGGGKSTVLGTSAIGLFVGAAVVGVALFFARPRPSRPANDHGRTTASRAPSNGNPRAMLWGLTAMNFALALVRESLSLWTPFLLVSASGLAVDKAIAASALLPLTSCVGALVAGPLADRGERWLLVVTFVPALLGAVCLACLAATGTSAPGLMIAGIALASAVLAMPMTLASGVLPLRVAATGGAKRLGIVDGAGSLGAVLAGGPLARIQNEWGAFGTFSTLALVALAAAAFAVVVHRVSGNGTPLAPLPR